MEYQIVELKPERVAHYGYAGDDPAPEDRAMGPLRNWAWGPQGWGTGFEMACTGVEGGLRAVLDRLAEGLALDYARNEIQARVHDFWGRLSVRERLAATQEYLGKYGHLLPRELTERSAARLKANFPGLLVEHPFIVRRIGRLGR